MTFTDEQRPAFPKMNAILLGVGLVIIILGMLLMLGSANEGEVFNFDIYSLRRTVVAPMVVLFGFVFIFFAILRKFKKEEK